MAADVNNNQPAAPGLALKALGVAEDTKLAGKSIDLNGDGKIDEAEWREALEKLKRKSPDEASGRPNLRLAPGSNNADQVAELIGNQKNGAQAVEDRGAPSLDGVTLKFFDRGVFEAMRLSLARSGEIPGGTDAQTAEIASMVFGSIQELAAQRAADLLSANGLKVIPPSLRRAAA
jgi:hypothetical protein